MTADEALEQVRRRAKAQTLAIDPRENTDQLLWGPLKDIGYEELLELLSAATKAEASSDGFNISVDGYIVTVDHELIVTGCWPR